MESYHFGEQLKSILTKRNIGYKKFSEMWGKSEQAVYDLLKKKDWNTSVMREVLVILKIDTSSFLSQLTPNPYMGRNNILGDSNTTVYGNQNRLNSQVQNLDDYGNDIKILRVENAAKDREIELLKEMVQLLKSSKTPISSRLGPNDDDIDKYIMSGNKPVNDFQISGKNPAKNS